MESLQLSLLNKWDVDGEFSCVESSVLLPEGVAVVLTSKGMYWDNYIALVLSSEGIKEIPIEYTGTSSRDYPVLFQYGDGFGIIISAKEVHYYAGDFLSPEIIPIKNALSPSCAIIPLKAQQRTFQNVSDGSSIAVCFELDFYHGDARDFALLEFDAAAKRAEWKSFAHIDKKAFMNSSDTNDCAPKIGSIKISEERMYAFILGNRKTSVNKWGMDYYALAAISPDGRVLEKLIESGDLTKDGKKHGVYGRFTDSSYVIMTPIFKADAWKGKQKLFSLQTREYVDIIFPRGMTKHNIENIRGDVCLTSLYDRGMKALALCKIG